MFQAPVSAADDGVIAQWEMANVANAKPYPGVVHHAVRRAEKDMRKLYDVRMPKIAVRRRGDGGLSSVFVAVHEPYDGGPWIDRVRRLPVPDDEGDVVAVEVKHGEVTDTIVVRDTPGKVTVGKVTLRGRLGVVRRVGGRPTRAWLLEGESLACGDAHLKSDAARYQGRILGGQRIADGDAHNAFATEADLPIGEVLRGRWMIVTHGNGLTHGYLIDRIERREEGATIVLADDHGLRISGPTTTECFFPRRTFGGPNTFVVPMSVSVTWQ